MKLRIEYTDAARDRVDDLSDEHWKRYDSLLRKFETTGGPVPKRLSLDPAIRVLRDPPIEVHIVPDPVTGIVWIVDVMALD